MRAVVDRREAASSRRRAGVQGRGAIGAPDRQTTALAPSRALGGRRRSGQVRQAGSDEARSGHDEQPRVAAPAGLP